MTDIKKVIDRQRVFYATAATRNIEFRKERLQRLRSVVAEKHDVLEEALYKDLKKCEFDAFAVEIAAVIDEIDFLIQNLTQWTQPVAAATPPHFGQADSCIYYEPYGVVLILNTWNYPVVLGLKQLAGVIAAGNCCVFKPSEVSAASSAAIAEVINTAFEPEYCIAIEGDAETATELLQQQWNFIAYTGSAAVGRIVATAAAQHLTPIALELGGKCPCIIDKTADIQRSVPTLCWGKFLNAGQTCTAPDHIWVHHSVKEALIEALISQIRKFYGEDIRNNPDYSRIINRRHFQRIKSLMDAGGRIVFGGETDEDDLFIAPTIIDEISLDSAIMQEEVFGPLLPVLTFDKIEDIVREQQKRDSPLALYLYTTDRQVEELIINNLSFGGGCVNATLLQMLNSHLPFGGVGASGYGSYEGKWSIETFSHKKSILRRRLSDEAPPMFPPYKENVKFLKQMYLQTNS